MFQSLLGFLMRCDSTSPAPQGTTTIVSIPVGFSDALRPLRTKQQRVSPEQFQSLLGFLMRCDASSQTHAQVYNVSIPVGFSDALRLQIRMLFHRRKRVSIPVGFSDALRHIAKVQDMFNSIKVSIPVGFSDALRRYIRCPARKLIRLFQSLLGFLMRCDGATYVIGKVPVFQSLLGFLMRCDTGI